MTYPIIIGIALFVVFAPSLFVLGLLVLHICQYGVRRFFASMHLSRLRKERDMDDEKKPKQYRKVIKTDPPALIRIKELGFRQPCGHTMHSWDSDKLVCLQCVLEGRQAARDLGRRS